MYVVGKTTTLQFAMGLQRFQDEGIFLKGIDDVLYAWLKDTKQPNVGAQRSAANVAEGITNQFVSKPIRVKKDSHHSHQTIQIQI